MNLIPYSRYARTVLNCEKKPPFLREFLDEPDTPLTFEWPPGYKRSSAAERENTQSPVFQPLHTPLQRTVFYYLPISLLSYSSDSSAR